MGTLDASNLMTPGGKMPGGRMRWMGWETATTWAMARSIFTLGWKKMRMTQTPL